MEEILLKLKKKKKETHCILGYSHYLYKINDQN